MSATIFILLAIAVAIILLVISKKRKSEKPSSFVCEHCNEHDCVCHETDSRGNGRK